MDFIDTNVETINISKRHIEFKKNCFDVSYSHIYTVSEESKDESSKKEETAHTKHEETQPPTQDANNKTQEQIHDQSIKKEQERNKKDIRYMYIHIYIIYIYIMKEEVTKVK